MLDREIKDTLASAHDEIVSLRARLAHVEPKAHAYDTIAQIARLTATEERSGMSVDVAWRIRTLLDKDAAEQPPQGNATANQGDDS